MLSSSRLSTRSSLVQTSHQILVHKGVRDGRTMTETDELTGEERIREVARMISGAEGITEDAKQYAGQMIEAADRRKREI